MPRPVAGENSQVSPGGSNATWLNCHLAQMPLAQTPLAQMLPGSHATGSSATGSNATGSNATMPSVLCACPCVCLHVCECPLFRDRSGCSHSSTSSNTNTTVYFLYIIYCFQVLVDSLPTKKGIKWRNLVSFPKVDNECIVVVCVLQTNNFSF